MRTAALLLMLAAFAAAGCGGTSSETTLQPNEALSVFDRPVPDALWADLKAGSISSKREVSRLERRARAHARALAQLALAGTTKRAILLLSADLQGRKCLDIEIVRPDWHGASPGPLCLPIHVEETVSSLVVTSQGHRVLAVVFAGDGDGGRVRFRNADAIAYSLPAITPRLGRRVFMLDIGQRQLARIELLRDGDPVAAEEFPP